MLSRLFEVGSCRWARAGLLPGRAAALSALAGALAAGWRARDALRSSQLRLVLLCLASLPHLPPSLVCWTDGTWHHMVTKYTTAATNKR